MKPESGIVLFDYEAPNAERTTGVGVTSIGSLRDRLNEVAQQEPRIIDMVSPTGNRLQLGLGSAFGCAQLIRENNMPPYLCAIAERSIAKGDVEFLLGGTPTPVPPERCLPVEQAMRIAEYFFTNDAADPTTRWVEV
jgi:hypothetical protein